jgi:hypothetical protein
MKSKNLHVGDERSTEEVARVAFVFVLSSVALAELDRSTCGSASALNAHG